MPGRSSPFFRSWSRMPLSGGSASRNSAKASSVGKCIKGLSLTATTVAPYGGEVGQPTGDDAAADDPRPRTRDGDAWATSLSARPVRTPGYGAVQTASQGTPALSTTVNVDNFARAETDAMFAALAARAGGV